MVDMNLVSLIDVFTILIFFLLSNTGGVETLPSPQGGEAARIDAAERSRARHAASSPSARTEILVDGAQGRDGRRRDDDRRRPDRSR